MSVAIDKEDVSVWFGMATTLFFTFTDEVTGDPIPLTGKRVYFAVDQVSWTQGDLPILEKHSDEVGTEVRITDGPGGLAEVDLTVADFVTIGEPGEFVFNVQGGTVGGSPFMLQEPKLLQVCQVVGSIPLV